MAFRSRHFNSCTGGAPAFASLVAESQTWSGTAFAGAGASLLARSRRYGDIRKALLSAPAIADADRSLPVSTSPHDWLAERRFALDEGLRRLVAAARAGAVAGGSIEDSVLRVERTETAVPDGAADLVADLYRRMPEARITDILLEVDDATRFTEAFTHL